LHQIAQQLRDPAKLSRFMKIVTDADGCIATTPEVAEIYQRVRIKRDPASVAFVPTPYPIEDQRWDFSLPPAEQSGIFVGTREWDVPSRNHFATLLVARQLCEATGERRTITEIGSMALDLLKDADLRAAIVAESQKRARERLSFEKVRSQLAKFFAILEGTREARALLDQNQKMISKSLMPFHFP